MVVSILGFPKGICEYCYNQLGEKIWGKVMRIWCSAKYLRIERKCLKCEAEWVEKRRYSPKNLVCKKCGKRGKIVKTHGRLGQTINADVTCSKCDTKWKVKIRTWY